MKYLDINANLIETLKQIPMQNQSYMQVCKPTEQSKAYIMLLSLSLIASGLITLACTSLSYFKWPIPAEWGAPGLGPLVPRQLFQKVTWIMSPDYVSYMI